MKKNTKRGLTKQNACCNICLSMKELFAKHELYAKKVIKIALNREFYNYFKNFVKFRFHILIAYFT